MTTQQQQQQMPYPTKNKDNIDNDDNTIRIIQHLLIRTHDDDRNINTDNYSNTIGYTLETTIYNSITIRMIQLSSQNNNNSTR